MKNLNNYIIEKFKVNSDNIKKNKKDILSLQWKDLVDYTGSSDNTLTKGYMIIGAQGKKFHEDYWDINWNNEYEEFVKAYKNAGGKIEEEYSKQGMSEVFCNYEGNNEATKYILLSFFRLTIGQYIINK